MANFAPDGAKFQSVKGGHRTRYGKDGAFGGIKVVTENENPLYVIQTLQERDDEVDALDGKVRDAVAVATAQLRREAEGARATAQAAEKRLADYDKMAYKVEYAEQRRREAEESCKESDRRRVETEARLKKAKKVIGDQKTQLEEMQQQVEILRAENENLLRIHRERSNANRKLEPKKKHSGYILISSQSRERKMKVGRYMESVTIWETGIQTPYDVRLRKEEIEELIKTDKENFLYELLGLSEQDDLSGNIMEDSRNIVYRTDMRAHFRAMYWEMIFYHTKMLEKIPEDMLGEA